MVTETAQILCTVLHKHGVDAHYKPTHINNPCINWASKSKANFKYLLELGIEIGNEYTYRYNKIHKAQLVLFDIQKLVDSIKFENNELTEFIQCTNDIKHKNVDVAYQMYFNKYKQHIAVWKNRDIPEWFKPNKNILENNTTFVK